MISTALAFLSALTVTLATTPLVRRLALRMGVVDTQRGDARRVHQGSTPRLGGVAIAIGFYVPLVGLVVLDTEVGRIFVEDTAKVWGLFAGGLTIAALGVLDDTTGANARQKFIVQFAVAIALYSVGFRVSEITTPFDTQLTLGFFELPITVLWIVGVINAMNLIDGLDGLAAGVGLVAALGTFVGAVLHENVLMMLFSAALSGALLGFLAFNFNPARIFMGDTGSMFLGYVLAVTSVQTHTKGSATVAFLIPILVVGLPIMDTFLAISRRLNRGRPLFVADRDHLHHQLLKRGFSHRQAVLVLWGIALLLGVVALLIAELRGFFAALVLVGAATGIAVFLRWLGYLEPDSRCQEGLRDSDYRAFNSRFREYRRELMASLSQESSVETLWARFCDASRAIDASSTHLWLAFSDPSIVPGTLELGHGHENHLSAHHHRRRYVLKLGAAHCGMLQIAWRPTHPELTVDEEYGVRRMVDVFEASLRRILIDAGESN